MNQNQNPFFVIHQELLEQRALIEKIIHNQKSVELPELDKYEQGVKVAMEELNWKQATIYCNIDKCPTVNYTGSFTSVELNCKIILEAKA